jgi:hypothetical protein
MHLLILIFCSTQKVSIYYCELHRSVHYKLSEFLVLKESKELAFESRDFVLFLF